MRHFEAHGGVRRPGRGGRVQRGLSGGAGLSAPGLRILPRLHRAGLPVISGGAEGPVPAPRQAESGGAAGAGIPPGRGEKED